MIAFDDPRRCPERAKPGPRWKLTLVTWLVIYPTITALLLVIGGPLARLAVPLRTLILTGLLVPLMTYLLMPLATRVFGGWLAR